MMSGRAAPLVLARFATLTDAMQGSIALADQIAFDAPPQMLAVLDRDDRLVLAGAAADGVVAWCQPVISAAEARAMVTEASQLRAQAIRAADWQEHGLSQRLRQRADLLEARLVDPLWRAFAAARCRSPHDDRESEEGRGVFRALWGERDRRRGPQPSPLSYISGDFHDPG